MDFRYMAKLYPQPNYKTIVGCFTKDEHLHPILKHCFHWSTSTITTDFYKLHVSTPQSKGGNVAMIHAQTSGGGKIQPNTLIFVPHDSIHGAFLSSRVFQQANQYLFCLANIYGQGNWILQISISSDSYRPKKSKHSFSAHCISNSVVLHSNIKH